MEVAKRKIIILQPWLKGIQRNAIKMATAGRVTEEISNWQAESTQDSYKSDDQQKVVELVASFGLEDFCAVFTGVKTSWKGVGVVIKRRRTNVEQSLLEDTKVKNQRVLMILHRRDKRDPVKKDWERWWGPSTFDVAMSLTAKCKEKDDLSVSSTGHKKLTLQWFYRVCLQVKNWSFYLSLREKPRLKMLFSMKLL